MAGIPRCSVVITRRYRVSGTSSAFSSRQPRPRTLEMRSTWCQADPLGPEKWSSGLRSNELPVGRRGLRGSRRSGVVSCGTCWPMPALPFCLPAHSRILILAFTMAKRSWPLFGPLFFLRWTCLADWTRRDMPHSRHGVCRMSIVCSYRMYCGLRCLCGGFSDA